MGSPNQLATFEGQGTDAEDCQYTHGHERILLELRPFEEPAHESRALGYLETPRRQENRPELF